MIAATAIAEDLPLFTTNPDDSEGLLDLLTVVSATRTPAPHERLQARRSRRRGDQSGGRMTANGAAT